MKRPAVFLFSALLFSITAAAGFAFSFQPLSADFTAAGPGSIQTFRIENDSEEPIAVKISMTTREMNFHGEEENRDASDLFLVYPPQIYLEPGLYQAVRVQWTGPESVNKEQAFRIIAEQLPVQTEASGTAGGSINIMLRYKGAVYVMPENPAADIEFFYAEPAAGENGEDLLAVEVFNRGNSHGILQDLTAEFTSEKDGLETGKAVLEGESLHGMTGENILAGQVRRFCIPWPEDLGEGNLSAELLFRPAR